MFSHGSGAEHYDWSVDAYEALKSILAFSLFQFSTNNAGDSSGALLPPEFHATASLCRAVEKIILNQATFISYTVLQGFVISLFWMIIVRRLVCKSSTPNLSSLPAY
jgi:hypothetical protein